MWGGSSSKCEEKSNNKCDEEKQQAQWRKATITKKITTINAMRKNKREEENINNYDEESSNKCDEKKSNNLIEGNYN